MSRGKLFFLRVLCVLGGESLFSGGVYFGAIISRSFAPCCGLAATIAFQAAS